MGFSQFTYWKRGTNLRQPLKKVPKGSDQPLVYHQLKNGDFDPSPYLKMSFKEEKLLQKEIEDWKKKNPNTSYETYYEWYSKRRAIYSRRITKLRDEHWRYDQERIKLFKKGLQDAFLLDLWDECLEECDGDVNDFYNLYKSKSTKLKSRR